MLGGGAVDENVAKAIADHDGGDGLGHEVNAETGDGGRAVLAHFDSVVAHF